MFLKSIKAACAAITLGGPVMAEEHLFVFIGDGFFPEIVYADPADDIRLVNRHNVAATITLTGDVELYNDGDDISDDGYTITMNPGDEIRFEADNNNEAGGFNVIIAASNVGGTGTNAAYNGTVSFDEEPDLGF